MEPADKTDKPLARLTKKKRKKIQATRIRKERSNLTTDLTEIKGIMKEYHKQMYAKTLGN